MILFKTFLKVLNQCKWTVILYTGILLFFAIFNMSTSDNNLSFVAEKPDATLTVLDERAGITEDFVSFLEEHLNIKNIEKQNVSDALFYRDINISITIPKGFRDDFLQGKKPTIDIQSTGDYQASLANILMEKYMKTANLYHELYESEEEIIRSVHDTLDTEISIEVSSQLNTDQLAQAKFFYNFLNYAILAGSVYVVCLILAIFRNEKIVRRTEVSSMNYKKINRSLILANGLFVLVLWFLYALISIVIVGNIMLSLHGILFLVNSLIFSLCALSLAFLLGNLVSNKDAISGIVNVVALGSSFLCGAFVPVEFLPNFVLQFAHVLPSYWYIHGNEIISSLDYFSFHSLMPLFGSYLMLGLFLVFFLVSANVVSRRKHS